MARKGLLSKAITLPDGRRKYIYGKTKAELDEKELTVKLDLRLGVNIMDKTTVPELIRLWYATEVAPNVRNNTELNMKCVLNKHLMPLVDFWVAKDVTPLQVKMWLNVTSKLNKSAAKICYRALKGSFNLAEENGLISRSPVLERFKAGGAPHKKREALTPEEEDQMLEVLTGTSVYLLVWFLLATGARRGEACGLQWDCVDFKKAEVSLRRNLVFIDSHTTELRNYMKTDAGTRTIPIPLDLRDALLEAKETSKSKFVFCRPTGQSFDATSFNSLWNNVRRRFGPNAKQTARTHGIVTETNVTPHVLRHTYATRCFEAGLDIKEVQRLMGHASPDVTLEIYTHYCEQSRREETFAKARVARSRSHNISGVPQKNP